MDNNKGAKLKVLWVTNAMAPYRKGLWTHLGQEVDLHLLLVDAEVNAAITAVRNTDWTTRKGINYTVENISTLRLKNGDGNLHISAKVSQINRASIWAEVVVITGWESPVYWEYMLAAKLHSKPVILFHESTDKSARFRRGIVHRVKSWIFRSANAVVVPGVASHQSVGALGVPEERIFEGFNAVDMEAFHCAGTKMESLGLAGNHDGHRYIYVGQLIPRKQVELLIQQFAKCRKSADSLSVVGSGELRGQLEKYAQRVGISSAVKFMGNVPYAALPSLLAAHDTLVLPSRSEVWGLVVNEALATGIHVVVSSHCGVADSVSNMQGVFVWCEEREELSATMQRSAVQWRGINTKPEILSYTNGHFAKTFMEGFRYVTHALANTTTDHES